MGFITTIRSMLGPFQGIAVLGAAVIVLLFFGLSGARRMKIFGAILAAIFYILSVILNIFYVITEDGSATDLLVRFDGIELVLSIVVVFLSLNVLLVISLYYMDCPAFIRIVILLLFSTIMAQVFIISQDFIMLFVSSVLFIFMVFQLISSTNLAKVEAIEAVNRFGVRSLVIPALLLFGFSLIYARAEIKSLSQVMEQDIFSNPFIITGSLVMLASAGLYLYLHPFQGPYLNVVKKMEGYSIGIIWFLYLPMGIAILIKLSPFIFLLPCGKSGTAGIIFMILAFLGFIASNAAAISTTSLRRILSFLILFNVSFIWLNLALFYLDIVGPELTTILNISILIPFIISFLPWYGLMVFLEKHSNSDSVENLRGLGRANIFIAVSLLVNAVFWLFSAYFMFPFYKFISEGKFAELPIAGRILLAGYFISIIFLGINIVRIIRELFRAPRPGIKPRKFLIPVFQYIYLGFFTVIIVLVVILALMGKIGLEGDKIFLWQKVINLF